MRSGARRQAVFVGGALVILVAAYWTARRLEPIVSLQYLVDVARDVRNLGGMGWTAGGLGLVFLVYLVSFSRAARRGRLGVFLLGLLLGPVAVLGFFVLSVHEVVRDASGRLLTSIGYTASEFQALMQQPHWMSQLFEATGFERTELLERVRELGLTSIARQVVDAVRRLVAFSAVAIPGLTLWWAVIWGRVGDWVFGAAPEPPTASGASAETLGRGPIALVPRGPAEPSEVAGAGDAPLAPPSEPEQPKEPGVMSDAAGPGGLRSVRQQWLPDAVLTALGRPLALSPHLEVTLGEANRLVRECRRRTAEAQKVAGRLRILHEVGPGADEAILSRLRREYEAQARYHAGALLAMFDSLRVMRRALWREHQLLGDRIRSRSRLLEELSLRFQTGEVSADEAAALRAEPEATIQRLSLLREHVDGTLAEYDTLPSTGPPVIRGDLPGGSRWGAIVRGWILWRWYVRQGREAVNDRMTRLVLPRAIARANEYLRRDPPAAFILAFIVLLTLCALLFGFGLETLGRQVADLAFILLGIGVAGRLWQAWRERRSERTGPPRAE